MRKQSNAPAVVAFVWLAIVIAIVVGWVKNVMFLVSNGDSLEITVGVVLRCIGIVFAPLGAVMGYWG